VDIPEIDVTELAARRASGVTIIDVRNPDEYVAAHVPGAILLPLPELAGRVDEVPEGEPVLLICAVGGRSRRACELLAPLGREVANVAGGTKAWIAAGYETNEGDAP
jgi:RND superfamily putative drug exporter